MNFRREREEEHAGLLFTPMLDVIFLLLIFFMTASIYGQLEEEIGIVVPTASEAVPPDRTPGEIIINITEDGMIVVNQRQYDLASLQELLNRVGTVFKGQAVKIRGDRRTQFGRAVEVLNACAKADIWNVSFAALTERETASSEAVGTRTGP
jgi:biopolymer transport protein ExbD